MHLLAIGLVQFWLAVYGTYVLWTGKMYLGYPMGYPILSIFFRVIETRPIVVYGTAARLLAIIMFLPLPLAILVEISVASLRSVGIAILNGWIVALDGGIVIVCVSALYLIGEVIASPTQPPRPPGPSNSPESQGQTTAETSIRAQPPPCPLPPTSIRPQ